MLNTSKDIAELSRTEFTEYVKNVLHTELNKNLGTENNITNIVDSIIKELYKNEIYIIPARLNYTVLGDAALSPVFDTGNPNHGWEYLVTKSKIIPKF